jgi:parallel beta-helix repeat protein
VGRTKKVIEGKKMAYLVQRKIQAICVIVIFISVSLLGISLNENLMDDVSVKAEIVKYVGGSGPGNFSKIQEAIDSASNGDTIYVYTGSYYENLIVNKSVTLIGNGSSQTTIHGTMGGDVIQITADFVNITGFKITNSGTNEYDAGIEINRADHCIIKNCTFPNNERGILINFSSYNNILNNTCNSNTYGEGIELSDSSENIIENNTCSNNWDGISIYGSSNNIIKNNTCSNNENGISIWFSTYNVFKNNKMFSCGIRIMSFQLSEWNTHTISADNLVNDKPIYYWKNRNSGTIPSGAGLIILANCRNIRIENQNIIGGSDGVLLGYSFYNTISKNTLSSHKWGGLTLSYSSNNIIENNVCSYNGMEGVSLELSLDNIIRNNIFEYNDFESIGLMISHGNIIHNNTFSNGYEGLWLASSTNNKIYHNNFISNNYHIDVDEDNNQWNNDYNEGNFWDDYFGMDNGDDNRQAGDGIGDTNIPHLNVDNYPLMIPSGWLNLKAPCIQDPGELDPDGDYTISWNSTCGATNYILEEDSSNLFSSPTRIYNGPDKEFNIKDRIEGTYYYRAKAYNEHNISEWSSAVDIMVNNPPPTPQDFNVVSYPDGNALNISWKPYTLDTEEYDLYVMTDSNSDWEFLDTIPYPLSTFNHTNLENGKTYYYQIQSKDQLGQASKFSKVISGIPEDIQAPSPPTDINIRSVSIDSISLEWTGNIELDLEGYNIYRNSKTVPKRWGDPIASISKNIHEYHDSKLKEFTTYYYVITAFDEIPNESNYSNIISVTTLLGQYPPVVNNSMSDFEIVEDHIDNTSINLYYWFSDVNNDQLFFRCEGNENIEVTIFQENGSVVFKPNLNWNGKETITFYASDDFSEISDKVDVFITPVNDPPGVPEIKSPKDKVEIEDGTSLDFKGSCSDPDIVYDDKLIFTWSSNISGELGKGKNLKGITCLVGKHLITLEVSDKKGETSDTSIRILVLETINSDSDDDGIPNIWERDHGLDPFNISDALLDSDNDGLTNLEEYKLNTEPFNSDTDGDGFNDKLDPYPLDPDRWDEEEITENNERDVAWGLVIIFVIVIFILLILCIIVIRRKRIQKEPKKDDSNNPANQMNLINTDFRIDPQSKQLEDIDETKEPSDQIIGYSDLESLRSQDIEPESFEIKDEEKYSLDKSQSRVTNSVETPLHDDKKIESYEELDDQLEPNEPKLEESLND